MKRNDNMFHFKFKVANSKEEIIFDAWMGSKRTEVQWIDAKGYNHQRYIDHQAPSSHLPKTDDNIQHLYHHS